MTTTYKLCVVGAGGVGKSALTIQLINNSFIEDYDPTMEDSYRKPFTLDGETVILEILDTAGQEELLSLVDRYLRGPEGFLIVYSVTSAETFEDASKFRDRVLRAKEADMVPMVLVGNKADLNKEERAVPEHQGAEMAKKWGCPFFETSAKTRRNVEEAFFELCKRVDEARPKPEAPVKKKGKCSVM